MKLCSFDVGIKNLAYCIIEKTETKFNVYDWNIINISDQDKKERFTCNYTIDKRKCSKYSKKYYLLNDIKYGICEEHANKCADLIYDKIHDTNIICNYVKKCKNNANYNFKENINVCDMHIKKEIKLIKVKNQNVNYESTNILAKNMFDRLDAIQKMQECSMILIENQPSLTNPIMKTIGTLLFAYFIMKGKNVKLMSPLNKLKLNKEITADVLGNCKNKPETRKQTKKLGIIYTKILLGDTFNMIKEHNKIDDLCDAFLQGHTYMYKDYKIDKADYDKLTIVNKIVLD